MKVTFPLNTLTKKISEVTPLGVIRHQQECYIVTGSTSDEDFQGDDDDIRCLNIHTGKVCCLRCDLTVELMDAELIVRDVIRIPAYAAISSGTQLTAEEMGIATGGQYLQAIKMVRTRTGLGLKAAKEMVDEYKSRMGV